MATSTSSGFATTDMRDSIAAPRAVLRMSGKQHRRLRDHLFPGDGKEAVAIALCGFAHSPARSRDGVALGSHDALLVHAVHLIPNDICSRESDRISWPTEYLVPLLVEARRKGLSVLKVHSHPGGYERFSSLDDESDRALFPSVAAWVEHDRPHGSAVMLPDGRLFGRLADDTGAFRSIDSVVVAGSLFHMWHRDEFDLRHAWTPDALSSDLDDFALRTTQAFGEGTVRRLRRMRVAVIGASGTGAWVIEMLARLGVGIIVVVDGDHVERKNLNRIPNATAAHAKAHAFKVDVAAAAIRAMELGTVVIPIRESLWSRDVVSEVAACDLVFGCVDSIDGRDLMNRVAVYHALPYLDVGVRLDADGRGGVEQICGSVHYVQPDGSSLLSRGVYTPADIQAAVLYRTEPAAYREQVREKYIRGVREDRPAVVSVNAFFASLAVNELLARVHGYRDDDNDDFATYGASLTQARLINADEGSPCPVLSRFAGRGDVSPPLGLPELSIVNGDMRAAS
ncbi:MAG TPA: ThiF family adenylyltransferase [Gemmatimonadaceae bacterium]